MPTSLPLDDPSAKRSLVERVRSAIEAFRAHRAEPEDVRAGVQSIDAMGLLLGRGDRCMLRRMRADATGRRLLEARHDILAVLSDRDRLRALPAGSLGRTYARFADERRLFPELLAEAVREARAESNGFVPESTPEAAYLHDRYRDLHDLWHVLTGFGTDMGGEWGLIAFQTKQVGYHSMALMALMGCAWTAIPRRPDLLRTWYEGRRRGGRASYLLAQDWERLLPLSLEAVREELGLGPAVEYRPFDYPMPESA